MLLVKVTAGNSPQESKVGRAQLAPDPKTGAPREIVAGGDAQWVTGAELRSFANAGLSVEVLQEGGGPEELESLEQPSSPKVFDATAPVNDDVPNDDEDIEETVPVPGWVASTETPIEQTSEAAAEEHVA